MAVRLISILMMLLTIITTLSAVPYYDEPENEDEEPIEPNDTLDILRSGINKRFYGKPFPHRRYALVRKMCIRRNHSCAFLGRNQCCSGTCRCRFFSANCYCKGKGLFQRWG